MNVAINRKAALKAIFLYEIESKIEYKSWKTFGIEYLQSGDDETWHFKIVNKQLLTWAMLKYGFAIEPYSNSQ